MLCEMGDFAPAAVETRITGARYLNLQSKQRGIARRFQAYAAQVFTELQNLIGEKLTGHALLQVAVFTGGERQLLTGLAGLLKTAGQENPKLVTQLIEIEPTEDYGKIINQLSENSYSLMDSHIRYHEGKRLIPGWHELAALEEGAAIPWRDGGVYLITGGAGGLGLIFAGEIAERVKHATLILAGRSGLAAAKQTRLRQLERAGMKISYREVDITDQKAVTGLIESILAEFGGLQGIIHSAGITRDNYLLKKTKEELQEVLAPKVTGLVNLDQASKEINLDFMVLFSSIAGSIGNPGQADYAAGNAFMDAYAKYRNELVAARQRQGRTLSDQLAAMARGRDADRLGYWKRW